MQAKFPDEFVKAMDDPYNHRYPRAEVILHMKIYVLNMHSQHMHFTPMQKQLIY